MLSKGGALISPIAAASPPVTLPAFVQDGVANNSGATTTIVLSANVGAGNSVVVCISRSATRSVTGISGGGIATWAQAVIEIGANSPRTEIWYGHGADGSSGTIVIQSSGSAGNGCRANASEYSGLNNAGPDATNSNFGLADSNPNTNSVTPSSAHNLVVGCSGVSGGGAPGGDYASGPTSGFTALTPYGAGTSLNGEPAYLIQSSAIAASTAWVLVNPLNWAAAIAVFGAP